MNRLPAERHDDENDRLRGRCPKGERLCAKAPFGHWKTQTFIAGPRCQGLTAPFVVDRPMNRRIFETYVETQLAPTLSPSDVVILDNLSAHKSPRAKATIKARGAWMLFLPPYSPDLIRSKWPSPSSKHTCEPAPRAPSAACGKQSAISAPSTHHRNAQITSTPQDMDTHECAAL